MTLTIWSSGTETILHTETRLFLFMSTCIWMTLRIVVICYGRFIFLILLYFSIKPMIIYQSETPKGFSKQNFLFVIRVHSEFICLVCHCFTSFFCLFVLCQGVSSSWGRNSSAPPKRQGYSCWKRIKEYRHHVLRILLAAVPIDSDTLRDSHPEYHGLHCTIQLTRFVTHVSWIISLLPILTFKNKRLKQLRESNPQRDYAWPSLFSVLMLFTIGTLIAWTTLSSHNNSSREIQNPRSVGGSSPHAEEGRNTANWTLHSTYDWEIGLRGNH